MTLTAFRWLYTNATHQAVSVHAVPVATTPHVPGRVGLRALRPPARGAVPNLTPHSLSLCTVAYLL